MKKIKNGKENDDSTALDSVSCSFCLLWRHVDDLDVGKEVVRNFSA